MNILLIGPRGSGKTSVGKLLAAERDLPFVDLDDLVIERFAESTVVEIWAAHGEQAWRDAEVEALREMVGGRDQIIALGGGTPMIDEARRLLEAEQQGGRVRVVYLKCTVAELERRLDADEGDRPSLTGGGVAEEIAEVLRQREETYESLADAIIDADRDPMRVAADVQVALSGSSGE